MNTKRSRWSLCQRLESAIVRGRGSVTLGQLDPARKQELDCEQGDWGVGWKVTRREMEPKQGWGQGWEGD